VTLVLNLPRWRVTESGFIPKLGAYGLRPSAAALRRQLKSALADSDSRHRRCYQRLSRALCESLGIGPAHLAAHRLDHHPEAMWLEAFAETAPDRPILLAPAALFSLRQLINAASADGVSVNVVSGFRSYARQTELIRAKLDSGMALQAILKISAAPGYSEHHSGCAVDLKEAAEPALEEIFASTQAYAWLCQNASRFGFTLSYPQGNKQGIAFEPWHWMYAEV